MSSDRTVPQQNENILKENSRQQKVHFFEGRRVLRAVASRLEVSWSLQSRNVCTILSQTRQSGSVLVSSFFFVLALANSYVPSAPSTLVFRQYSRFFSASDPLSAVVCTRRFCTPLFSREGSSVVGWQELASREGSEWTNRAALLYESQVPREQVPKTLRSSSMSKA